MSDSESVQSDDNDLLDMAIGEFSTYRDDTLLNTSGHGKVKKVRMVEDEPRRDENGKYIKKKKKPEKKKKIKKKTKGDDVYDRYASSDDDNISIRMDGIATNSDEEESRANPPKNVLFRPAMLPEEQTEHTHEVDEDVRELQEQAGSIECKLCDLGDNGLTKFTGEALKEIFEIEHKLFRKVPDQVIWKLQRKKWEESIVIPNGHLGIHVDHITEGEIRRHYKQYHDISNPRRLLWDQVFFLLRSMNYFRKNGGIWETKIVNNVEQAELEFNSDRFKEWATMSKQISTIIALSEKIEVRDRSTTSSSSSKSMSGRTSSRRISGSREGPAFTPY